MSSDEKATKKGEMSPRNGQQRMTESRKQPGANEAKKEFRKAQGISAQSAISEIDDCYFEYPEIKNVNTPRRTRTTPPHEILLHC
jgi:hypothetical protein